MNVVTLNTLSVVLQSYDINTGFILSELKPLQVNFVTCTIESNSFLQEKKITCLSECVVVPLDPSEDEMNCVSYLVYQHLLFFYY